MFDLAAGREDEFAAVGEILPEEGSSTPVPASPGISILKSMIEELVKATNEVHYMVSQLRRIKNPQDMINHCRNTSDIEHKVDDLYRDEIRELFEKK